MPQYFDFQLATVLYGFMKDEIVAIDYIDSDSFCNCELSGGRGFVSIHKDYLEFWVSVEKVEFK